VVTARDQAGNEARLVRGVRRSAARLEVALEGPSELLVLPSGELELAGRVDSNLPAEALAVRLQGQPVAPDAAGRVAARLTLAEGEHVLSLVASGPGCADARAERRVLVDLTPPVLRLEGEPPPASTADEALELAGRVEDRSPRVVLRAGQTVLETAPGPFRLRVPLRAGENAIALVAEDAAGRRSEPARCEVLRLTVPDWFLALPAGRRPPLPLPEGLEPGALPGEYLWSRDGSRLVWVPPARLAMGSAEGEDDEAPAHEVALSRGVFLGKHEVTRAQLARVLELPPPPADEAELPAGGVSWAQAVEYCRRAGLRLPGEAEWELAARSAGGHRFPWGDAPPDPTRANLADQSAGLAWAEGWDDGFARAAPVGSYPRGAAECGALDLAGNVREWVADRFGLYAAGAEIDPQGPPAGALRALRGSSWRTRAADARATYRDGYEPEFRDEDTGFRVALSPR
jgi:iron(II)-dependent oxidoreductase